MSSSLRQSIIHGFVAHTCPAASCSHTGTGLSLSQSASNLQSEVIAWHGGIALHLSSRSATGYEGVSLRRTRPSRPYRVKAPGGVLLGDFADVLQAAVCYAQYMRDRRGIVPRLSSLITPDSSHSDGTNDFHMISSSLLGPPQVIVV